MFDFLSQKFSSLFSSFEKTKKITEKEVTFVIEQVKEALLEADVPYDVVQAFTQSFADEAVGEKIMASRKPSEQLLKMVHDKIVSFLGSKTVSFDLSFPSIVMVMGLQGSGKTTTIGKFAYKVKKDAEKHKKQRKILVGSVDFYRPAAIDQLESLAKKVQVSFYRAQNTDPVAAAHEIAAYATNNAYDVLLLDTAGRLHVDTTMLQELKNIDRSISPTHKLLVLDAMTGQESLAVAQAFEQAVGFQAAVLTKMDSDTRGGAAFAFRYALKKPIAFIGEGEKMSDLASFHPDRAAERMLGMGDMTTLMELLDEKMTKEEQQKKEKSLSSGAFTLQDFADQMDMMNKLGSMSQVMKYMPGGMGFQMSPDVMQKGEVELKAFRAILSSMTQKERLNPHILTVSRKKLIAVGAGTDVKKIDALLKRFEEAKQYVKLFSKFGPF